MNDRRDDRSDRNRSHHDHHQGDRHREGDRGRRDDRQRREDCDQEGPHGRGPDTRFLQLEMSELLYAEAESVTQEAFRDLLMEAAKSRLRERFGDQIVGLAQLAVDEVMGDVFASLDIEARIRQQNRERQGRRERLSGILRTGRDDGPSDDRECPESEPGHGPESDEDH